jgi:UDP-N-acetylmuramate dehydrogenase
MGFETKDFIESVEVYKNGEVVRLECAACKFGYRDSIFKHNGGVVLSVTLRLKHGNKTDSAQKMIEYLKYRGRTQPKLSSSGCVFKNVSLSLLLPKIVSAMPEEFRKKEFIPAGWLIEQAGCKGLKVGRAEVSKEHGNFIVNTGGATFQDLLELIELVRDQVRDKFGVVLEEEIQII